MEGATHPDRLHGRSLVSAAVWTLACTSDPGASLHAADGGATVASDLGGRPDAAADAEVVREPETIVLWMTYYYASTDIWSGMTEEFYEAGNPDRFEVLTFFMAGTDLDEVGPYSQTVRNTVEGIGRSIHDVDPRERLSLVLTMGEVHRWAGGPHADFCAPESFCWAENLAVLGQEFAHWFGAFVNVDLEGVRPDILLGSSWGPHWSFFCHTGGSYLGGNFIYDGGDGSFETGRPNRGLGALDLYLMGLAPPERVEGVFCVEDPTDVGPRAPDRDSSGWATERRGRDTTAAGRAA
jgi:hypothetical protein